MASRTNTRRLSLDFFRREKVPDKPSEIGISKHMDLRIPFQYSSSTNDIRVVECECCGLTEDCTVGYIRATRNRFYGKWVCGLCTEAVIEESYKLGVAHNIVCEEGLNAHMEICTRFSKKLRANPALSLTIAMTRILRLCSKGNVPT